MDWDWEDGPPQEPPRGAAREQQPRPADEPLRPDPGSSSFSDAIDRFDEPSGYDAPDAGAEEPDYDDERTQLIRLPSDSGSPATSDATVRPGAAVPSPGAAVPSLGAAGEPPDVVGSRRVDRRPLTTEERVARRARRRRQIRRRRLVALAVIVVIIVLIVVLVVRGCGGSTAATVAAGVLLAPVGLRPLARRSPQAMAAAADDGRAAACSGRL